MPVEIRNLAIRAVIDTGGKKGGNSTGPSSNTPPAAAAAGGGGQDPGQLVDLCVEKIMEILKERSER